MRRPVAVCLLVAGLLLVPLTAAAAPGLADATATAVGADAATSGAAQDGANDSISAGERLSGAIGAEQAELDGEVGERSFGAALAAAETNDSAAAVVADRLDRIETRLEAIEERNATIAERYENGSLTHGAYAARAAAIEAERASLHRQLNATRTAADGLPADALAANDVDAARIDELRTRASELGGQSVRDLARSIAGPNVGNGVGPDDRGPGDIPGLGEDGLPGNGVGPDDRPGQGDGPGGSDDGNASDEGPDSGEGSDDSGDGSDGSDADDPDDPDDSSDPDNPDDPDDPDTDS